MRKRTQNLVQMGCEPAKKRLFGEPAALEHLAPQATAQSTAGLRPLAWPAASGVRV